MVKRLTKEDGQAIQNAVKEAERQTSAEIVVVLAPASDPYDDYILLFGLIAGSIAAIAFWIAKWIMTITGFVAIQFCVLAFIWLGAWLRTGFLRFVPPRIQRHRAANRAAAEFADISRRLKPATPLVVFYVSLAEHYIHIVTNSVVREKIPDSSWTDILETFKSSMKKSTVRAECIAAINAIASRVSPLFPEKPEGDALTGLIEL
ncbi:MAG: hypothetical protein PHW76_01855 [Alphaproteobacteria bacterium]|nr:hypothetical protein [Alphaproteobacteria bacterium]